ncbi:LLM class flavin-dependent oxidoreductase [Alphaproteobacteria bacterium]|nr:LLM class flavin-dependent oxidoreductase [Alphaproteobacteria bacterium]
MYPWRSFSVTKTLNLATSICLVVHRGLIQTTKLVVSLEQLSSGRFLFGIEVGWNVKQMVDHGTKFKIRTSRMNEQIEVMVVRCTEEK